MTVADSLSNEQAARYRACSAWRNSSAVTNRARRDRLAPGEFFEDRQQRPPGLVIVLPGGAFGDQGGDGAHREPFWIEPFFHLAPFQRHGDGGAFARAGAEGGDRRRH